MNKHFLTSVEEFRSLLKLGVPVHDVDLYEGHCWTTKDHTPAYAVERWIENKDLYIFVE